MHNLLTGMDRAPDSEVADDEAQAEVQWHGTNVADELELVADQLQVLS